MSSNHNPRGANEIVQLVRRIASEPRPARGPLAIVEFIERNVALLRWWLVSAHGVRTLAACVLVVGTAGWVAARLTNDERPATPQDIATGRLLFLHDWQAFDPVAAQHDPLVAAGGDGLGPVFNARSCATCHFQGGLGGAGHDRHNVLTFDVVATKTNPTFHAGVVHAQATYEVNHECPAEVNRLFPIVKGEQRKIQGCVVTLPDFNPVNFSPINTPALFGAGQLQKISDAEIKTNQRRRQLETYPREVRGDFGATPAGRPRILRNGRVGRYGWKAQFASLDEFVASACAVEIGLSNPKRRQDRPHQKGEDHEAALDITSRQLFELTAFTGSLPAPICALPEDSAGRAEAAHGERLFSSVGCADCHTPNLGKVAGVYSDLLLHKLEDDTSRGPYGRVDPNLPPPDGDPRPNEWKTPPLWGVADSAPYFHDGASRTLAAAIERHGGQAQAVTDRYRGLSPAEQRALVRFLGTLKAPSVEPAPPPRTELAASGK